MMQLRRTLVSVLLLLLLGSKLLAQQHASDLDRTIDRDSSRVTVLGASLSRGLQLGAEAKKRSAEWLFANLPEARKSSIGLGALYASLWQGTLRDRSDLYLFTRPLTRAAVQVEAASGDHPQLILAVDFLFWFGYWPDVEKLPKEAGSKILQGYGEHDRELEKCLRSLEKQAQGFALIDQLLAETEARIVLGDYPDMFGALPVMLHPRHIPLRRTLDELNRRLAVFVATRPRIVLFKLADYVARSKRGEVVLPGGDGRKVSTEAALQGDQLHPTRLGTALVMHELLAHLALALGSDAAQLLPRVSDFSTIVEHAGALEDYRALLAAPSAPPAKVAK